MFQDFAARASSLLELWTKSADGGLRYNNNRDQSARSNASVFE